MQDEKNIAPETETAVEEQENRYSVFVSTHPGKVRSENQDNFIVNVQCRSLSKQETNLRGDDVAEPLVLGVFDGMGGEACGELASMICADTAAAVLRSMKHEGMEPDDAVCAYVTKSNHKIVEMLASRRARRGGSTFVMVILTQGVARIYSLGDSRVYLCRDGVLRQITNDHTLAMKKYLANIYTLEEAQASADSHKLTMFLGVDTEETGLKPEIYPPISLYRGDQILLCSDGLYDMCSDEEILSTLQKHADNPTVELGRRAMRGGGVDNVTCVVVEKTR